MPSGKPANTNETGITISGLMAVFSPPYSTMGSGTPGARFRNLLARSLTPPAPEPRARCPVGCDRIERLPAGIFNGLDNLRTLNLAKNALVELPDSIGGLINLSTLDLTTNKLRDIKFPMEHLVKLYDMHSYRDLKRHGLWLLRNPLNQTIFGPQTKGIAQLLSSGRSTLLTEKSQILKRWAEHFRSVSSPPFKIADTVIFRLTRMETNTDLDFPSSFPETIRVVQQLFSEKAPVSDAIPAEIYKYGS
nr:unnamed protein product [Spirometra erinaceieuropaei]